MNIKKGDKRIRTVENGLDSVKADTENLQKENEYKYVTPEMFGAKGDANYKNGTGDWYTDSNHNYLCRYYNSSNGIWYYDYDGSTFSNPGIHRNGDGLYYVDSSFTIRATDDTTPIKNAIAKAIELDVECVFLAKKYRITEHISVVDGLNVRGTSAKKSVLVCDNCNGFYQDDSTVIVTGWYINNLKIEKEVTPCFPYHALNVSESNYGIHADGFTSSIQNVVCKGFSYGFDLFTGSATNYYMTLVKDSENKNISLCNAIGCDYGFNLFSRDMFADQLVAGYCNHGIRSAPSCKLSNTHVWGWTKWGYWLGDGRTNSICCNNLELESFCGYKSAGATDIYPIVVAGSANINGLSLWNLGTNKPIITIGHAYGANININNVNVGTHGTYDSSLVGSTVAPTLINVPATFLESEPYNIIVRITANYAFEYLTGTAIVNNSPGESTKIIASILTQNASSTITGCDIATSLSLNKITLWKDFDVTCAAGISFKTINNIVPASRKIISITPKYSDAWYNLRYTDNILHYTFYTSDTGGNIIFSGNLPTERTLTFRVAYQ